MNARERLFCEEYLIDLNATAAALRAGYKQGTAENAARWLKPGDEREKPGLRARVERLMAERSLRTGITADRVLREYARIAFADIRSVADADGRLIDAGEDDGAAIASIRVKKGADFEEREVRMHDKNRALDMLGKHLGLFTDQVNVNVTQMPKIIAAADGSVEIDAGLE